MDIFLKSLPGVSYDVAEDLVALVQAPENAELFSQQEITLFKFIRKVLANTGQVPTESFILRNHPEYTVPLQNAEAVSERDLRSHLALLLDKRRNLTLSRTLMDAARQVVESGVTYEITEALQQLRVAEESREDSTESVDSFKVFYERKKSQPTGLLTFVKEIDERIGGLPLGGVSVLFGYVAQFKTMMANNIAYRNAKALNYNIAIVSLEVSKEDVLINLLSRHAADPKFDPKMRLTHKRIRNLQLTEDEEKYLFEVVAPDFYSTGGYIKIIDETDLPTFSFSDLNAVLEKADDEAIEKTRVGIDCVIWDHANLFKFNSAGGKRFQSEGSEINEYVSYIRKKSIAFRRMPGEEHYRKVHMMVLGQANREGFKRADKLKGIYDLRAISEANELERGAQIILSIYTNEDLKAAKEATMQILKNRTGATLIEPCSIYVDPEIYVAGQEMHGFQEMVSMDDLNSLFGDGADLATYF